jgi:hypothetical protein
MGRLRSKPGRPLAGVAKRERAGCEQLRRAGGAADTDPLAGRSAGRIEDELWGAFLAKARAEGLSNTDAMRRMIRARVGMPEPAPLWCRTRARRLMRSGGYQPTWL